jgi:predicted MFS family arabinose efflux permease
MVMAVNGRFQVLLSAYFISSVGDWVSRLAVPVILFKMTGSAFCLSLAYAMTFLPYLVVTPVGGVLADAVDRRTLLVVVDIAAGSLVILMALSAWLAPETAWSFYPLLFLLFSLVAVYHPAFQSYLPSLLAESEFAKGNSYISAADNVTDVLGPILGGFLITTIGAMNALYLDAASFLFSAACICFIEARPLVLRLLRNVSAAACWDDLREGALYVFGHQTLRYGCILFAVTNFGITLFTSNLMFFLISFLGLESIGIGIILGVAGCGGLVGSLMAPHIIRHASDGFVMLTANIVGGLGILALAWLQSPLAVAAIWGFVLATNSVVVVTFFTLRQRVVPDELLGRAVAMSRFISFLAIPLGSVLGGWLVEQSGSVMLTIILSGAIVTIAGFLALLTPLGASAALAD